MKIILGVICFLIQWSFADAKAVDYVCTAVSGDQIAFRLKIAGAHGPIFTVSNMDETEGNMAVIDEVYVAKNPGSQYKRLKALSGGLSAIGDGADGFKVELLMNQSILQGADYGYAKYQARGPEGYYSVFYKCSRDLKK